MNDKLEEARRRLREAAGEYCGSMEWGAVDDAQLTEQDLRQAARDFAAAEILERYQRPRPPPGPDENAKTDDEWLRAGGLAMEVGDE